MGKPEKQERISISYYSRDAAELAKLRQGLMDRGLKLDPTKVLRSLIHTTAQDEFLAYAIIQWKTDEAKTGPRESDYVDGSLPSIVLPASDVEKLDNVIDEMTGKGMLRVKRSYVIRARLRFPPPLDLFYTNTEKFLMEYPDGRTRAGRAQDV